MKKYFHKSYAAARAFVFTIMITLHGVVLMAQRPTHIPGEGEPVGFFESLSNIIFFIVLPVLILVIYLLYRRYLRKEREKVAEDAKEANKPLE